MNKSKRYLNVCELTFFLQFYQGCNVAIKSKFGKFHAIIKELGVTDDEDLLLLVDRRDVVDGYTLSPKTKDQYVVKPRKNSKGFKISGGNFKMKLDC